MHGFVGSGRASAIIAPWYAWPRCVVRIHPSQVQYPHFLPCHSAKRGKGWQTAGALQGTRSEPGLVCKDKAIEEENALQGLPCRRPVRALVPAHSEHSRLLRRRRGQLCDTRSSRNALRDSSPITNAFLAAHSHDRARANGGSNADSHGSADADCHPHGRARSNGGSVPDSNDVSYSNRDSDPNPNPGSNGYTDAGHLRLHQQRGLAHLCPPR